MSPLQHTILQHLRAEGPVSFSSIRRHVARHFEADPQTWEIAAALTLLIRHGHAALYDDGTSFDWEEERNH